MILLFLLFLIILFNRKIIQVKKKNLIPKIQSFKVSIHKLVLIHYFKGACTEIHNDLNVPISRILPMLIRTYLKEKGFKIESKH